MTTIPLDYDPPTVFVLRAEGFEEVAHLDYICPDWIEIDWSFSAINDTVRASLPTLAALLHRIVPGVDVHLVPGLQPDARYDGQVFSKVGPGGFAILSKFKIAISYNSWSWGLIDTGLHEAWHVVENSLSQADFDLVRRFVSRGIPLPEPYFDGAQERTARAFTAYALYRLSGSSNPTSIPPGHRTVEQIFAEVLAGRYKPWSGISVFENASPGFLQTSASWLANCVRRLLAAPQRRTT